MQEIPFQSEHHRITKELEEYIRFLLGRHTFTNKEISELSGVGQNIVKAIDKRRLEELYVEDGKLRRPDEQARFLGIDEFKLHNGHKYATHIINMKNGHILWIAEGKKKQVVYDFIEHVGMEWMSHRRSARICAWSSTTSTSSRISTTRSWERFAKTSRSA